MSFEDIKVICTAIVVPLLAMAAVAFAEVILRWHFYEMPSVIWHPDYLVSRYVLRLGNLTGLCFGNGAD